MPLTRFSRDSSTVAGAWAAGLSGDALKEHLEKAGYESARPSGWDPAERLKDQDVDGVHAEVLYGTLGMRLYRMTDAALQQEFFRVYNDWLAEFCAYDPQRLHGLGLVSLWDVDAGAFGKGEARQRMQVPAGGSTRYTVTD